MSLRLWLCQKGPSDDSWQGLLPVPQGQTLGVVRVDWASVFLLGFAISVDGLGAGLVYGMKRIRIPLLSLMIISLSSGIVLGASMLAGRSVTWLMDRWVAKAMGSCMLFVMGVAMIFDAAKRRGVGSPARNGQTDDDCTAQIECGAGSGELPDVGCRESETLRENSLPPCGPSCVGCPYLPAVAHAKTMKVKIGSLSLVIHILREPEAADLDGSGVLSPAEAALLGTALALDAAGAGFAAAVTGLWAASVPVVAALMKLGAVALGARLGSSCSRALGGTSLVFAPGACMILLSLLSLL